MNSELRLPQERKLSRAFGFWAFVAAFLAIGFASVLLSTSAQAAEESTHIFNATLSLTGDCSTSTGDPVPDPGCPSGEHPPHPFTKSSSVAVDPSGDRYVASAGALQDGSEGRVDVFDATGEFLTEVPVQLPNYEASVAVDSEGYLYVMTGPKSGSSAGERLLRFKPIKYDPASGEIRYDPTAAVVIANPWTSSDPSAPAGSWGGYPEATVLVNPHNDHVLASNSGQFSEFASAKEGNTVIEIYDRESFEELHESIFWGQFTVDWSRERLYFVNTEENATSGQEKSIVRVYPLHSPSGPGGKRELLYTIDGSTTPTGRFASEVRYLPVAVDETTGHLFVGDMEAPTRRIYEFDSSGQPVSTIEGPLSSAGVENLKIAYDNGANSPTKGYLFVPSGNKPAHSLAFEPKPTTGPPVVEGLSVSGVTTSDAILHGGVNPDGVETTYRIEYTTEQDFAEHGFEGASLLREATLQPASEAVAVSAPASGLAAGTTYRFRVVAESPEGEDEAESSFTTFALEQVFDGCPNEALRTGPSAVLPDCRAFELVTPSDTGGHAPYGSRGPVNSFTTRQVSPAGDKLPFKLEGTALPGLEGTGSFNGDAYLATRTATGWSTSYEGPPAAESPGIFPGTSSPDQAYSFWEAEGEGNPAEVSGERTSYVRYPDGHSQLLGQGSLGVDPSAAGLLITSEGAHILFATEANGPKERIVQLEPAAAPDGTKAIYDRTADGVLHVVSLKPGEVPFGAGEPAYYRGASLDGAGVAFEVNKTLYLRYDDTETFEVGEGVKFAGVAEGGRRVFYMEGGDLKAFDVERKASIPFSQSGDVTPVVVAVSGRIAYFVSPSVLSSQPNPNGAEAQPGRENLYRSEEGQATFVATVTERDVNGEEGRYDGLGLWLQASEDGTFGRLSDSSTPDGEVLLFQSRAQLTGYDPEGHAEIYRYDGATNELSCLSCGPTGTASSDAALHYEEAHGDFRKAVYDLLAWPENLRADGRRAFFESSEALVADDTDGFRDVYEWEDQGVGSCTKPGGCVYLISSGQSGREEHLWAVSESGNDVFFISSDLLTEEDTDETQSVYDARVDGGFAPAPRPAAECLGEACQPPAVVLADLTPASFTFQGLGNVKAAPHRIVHKGKRHKKHKKRKRHGHRRRAGHGNGRKGR